MTHAFSLSPFQAAAVLDHAPVAVFVSSIDDRSLLYANRLAKETFLLEGKQVEGLCCYHVAGFSCPCPFCKELKIGSAEPCIREYRHLSNQRFYQLSGQIIDWEGTPAHIEYIADITDKKREEERIRQQKKDLLDIFGSIPCGLGVYRFKEGKITPVFHNAFFYAIMGYSSEHCQSVEQDVTFLGVHPEDLAILQEKIWTAIKNDGAMQHTYRLWNDEKKEYCWLNLEVVVKPQQDGTKLLYGVYVDMSRQALLEQELVSAGEKMQSIINAIPGGVALYKVSDIFETVYYSNGVAELTGYTAEEYRELSKGDASAMTYKEDTAMVVEKLRNAVREHKVADFEFRKLHRDGHIVWVHIQAMQIGEEDGFPLVQCVFHNITQLKDTQTELEHLLNSIPGGIVSYRVDGEHLTPLFCSDGVMELSGYSREELAALVRQDLLDAVYEQDRERVAAVLKDALQSGENLNVSYRMYHKNGNLIWLHVSGRRIGPLTESGRFYAVFTGTSEETRLFQSLTNDTADGIYVIGKDSYELFYINEAEDLFAQGRSCVGKKCYEALHGKKEPCEFCTLKTHRADGKEHEMVIGDSGQVFTTHFRETNWNGIPAYVKYIRNATEEAKTRMERDRLEQYFQTVISNLPGGVVVIRMDKDGKMLPEYLSDGFVNLTEMRQEEAWELYRQDALDGVHPDDRNWVEEKVVRYLATGREHFVMEYRLRKGKDDYTWVRNNFSMLHSESGETRIYAVYQDISREMEERKNFLHQYNDRLVRHYQQPGPNTLVLGHSNITKNRFFELIDHTGIARNKTSEIVREEFFCKFSRFIVDQEERQAFLNTYLDVPALTAFAQNETEKIQECFVQLPGEQTGRYVRIKMNMVDTPDSTDVTGILTVTDITEQVVADRALRQISLTGYDFVADADLIRDTYRILTSREDASCQPPLKGCHSQWVEQMLKCKVVPRDQKIYRQSLEPDNMLRRLKREGAYSFAVSLKDEKGDIRTQNMMVSAIDLRLKRVCLSRIDITDSVREQQGLLNMIAYTFDLAGFIHVQSGHLTMYTRQTVLENLAPYLVEDYRKSVDRLMEAYGDEISLENKKQFSLDRMVERLEQSPVGYDFVIPYQSEDGLRYKQVNVLWGDHDHRTICLVRMDVTDIISAERKSKRALKNALKLAEDANRAKSDFLSAMSHDIRTPLNAVIGMTALATAHWSDPDRVRDCLKKISVSSKHLLSLVNDILDMNKLEESKLELDRRVISLSELLEQLSAIMTPQARAAGLLLDIRTDGISHNYFYGDALRLSQIFINILGNAVKYTQKGGRVDFLTEEINAEKAGRVRYRFRIQDTGIGMTEEFLSQVFVPFTRSSAVSRIEGTGLGLSIVKGLVDLLGGTILVQSNPGEGTVFVVELEADTATGQEDNPTGNTIPESDTDESMLKDCCILVAEDNVINAEITCGLLELFGATAVVKTDGKQAVAEFLEKEAGTYDAVLMDIQMPEMNGYEAAQAIRRSGRPDAADIPIIAMTANAFAEDVQASQEAGMNSHIPKPIDVDLLRTVLVDMIFRR